MEKITYEDIKKANETIKNTNIKGKDYAEVNQRIKAFRMVYPTGSIETELLSDVNGKCIFKAIVKDEEGKVLGTGTAYEKEGNSYINKTSYLENCETSATGRALGMAGFGIDTSIASADEVVNAMNNQNVTNRQPNNTASKARESSQNVLNSQTNKINQSSQSKDPEAKIDSIRLEQINHAIEKNKISDVDVEKILFSFGYTSTSEIKIKDYMKIISEFKNLVNSQKEGAK